jgi:DNA modification methylase
VASQLQPARIGVAEPAGARLRAAGEPRDPVDAVLRGQRRWAVVSGDGCDVLRRLPDASVDAVVTDPPYPREYVPLYARLAAELPRVLNRGGSFLAIVPHYALPEVLPAVGRFLKYRWTMCMWQGDGNHPRMAMGIEVVWKPVVWWVNEAWPAGRGFVKDGFVNAPPDKAHHKWEQSLSWAEYCVRFAPRGGVVVDPLCGAGTTGVAAVAAGYRYVGVDHDPAALAVARRRITVALVDSEGEE